MRSAGCRVWPRVWGWFKFMQQLQRGIQSPARPDDVTSITFLLSCTICLHKLQCGAVRKGQCHPPPARIVAGNPVQLLQLLGLETMDKLQCHPCYDHAVGAVRRASCCCMLLCRRYSLIKSSRPPSITAVMSLVSNPAASSTRQVMLRMSSG